MRQVQLYKGGHLQNDISVPVNNGKEISICNFQITVCFLFLQCGQLSDFGAESFLVTFQESDKTCQHIGSVKGDHYCLLHSDMLKDFSDFCQGEE